MLNNSQGSQGNNDLQTAQNAIAILIDQISKARGVGRTIVYKPLSPLLHK